MSRTLLASCLLVTFLSSLPATAVAEDAATGAGSGGGTAAEDSSSNFADGSSTTDDKPSAPPKKKTAKQDGFDPDPEKTWGTFYDPQSVFCGDYDCYKILGFDHETWGDSPPDSKLITRSYRSLSRRWHPDKNRGKQAKDRFVKINRAYEILTNNEKREEYDYLRDRPDEYFHKYGSNVLYKYAPKSDTAFVILLLLSVGCAFTWFAQKAKWQTVADRLVQASVEGLGLKDGGTEESLEIRDEALEMLAAKREAEKIVAAEGSSTPRKKRAPDQQGKAVEGAG